MNPMISVIVPVYNVENFLCKCVDSLLVQTYDNYEIILVDDGSTDESGKIADTYDCNHEIVRTVHKKNGGLGSARNYGTRMAKGDWITYVDSDDYVEATYLYDLWKLIDEYKADMAITKIIRELKEGKAIDFNHMELFQSYFTDSKDAFVEVYSGGKVGWSGCGKLIKKDIVLQEPFADGYYEDCATTYKQIEKCNRIAIGDFRWNYHYIIRENSILSGKYGEKCSRAEELIKELDEYICAKYPDLGYVSFSVAMTLVLQILNLSQIERNEYKSLFYCVRPYFRKNCLTFLRSKSTHVVDKGYAITLCTYPFFLKVFSGTIQFVKTVYSKKDEPI